MLIFIHGMWSNTNIWKNFIKYFEERNFPCKAIDLKEGLNLKEIGFIDYVKKVGAIATKDDILIGHSMGGLIVQKVAEMQKIKGGVAICSAPPKGIKFRNVRMILSSAKYLPKIILRKPFKPSYSFLKKYILNCLPDDEARNIFYTVEPEAPKVAYELAMNKIEVNEKKVSCPLLFIATKDDKASPPKMVEKIAKKYNAQFIILDGCHWIFSKWQEIAEEISKFLIKLYESP
ncbi:MAG: hypothetical protein DRN11_02745 [Thermoplasmata archaeon]|nr:MAG: hypothetical protein DRN11_02745 [Thermoplasmata archaeon]